MKAITLWQPWATFMALGLKKIETRSWDTRYRGPLAIHAAASMNKVCKEFAECPYFKDMLVRRGFASWRDLPLGAVVATVELVTTRHAEDLNHGLSRAEFYLGDFSKGRFGWVTDHLVKLATPVPAVGRQGFWEWSPTDERPPD